MNFSVLMSVYSKERPSNFDKALESILINQTLKPSEFVLIADGELTDELYATIEKYRKVFSNFRLVLLPNNVGLGKALNEGLKHCTYEWVGRMDSDDISLPNRFERQIQYIEQNPDVSILGAWIEEFTDGTDRQHRTRRTPEQHSDIVSYAKSRSPINHPVVMFNKQRVLEVGGYEHCTLFEDYWLWVRLLHRGNIFHNIQEPLLLFRTNDFMYERRGGTSYIRSEYQFFKKTYDIGFISRLQLIQNIIIRTIVRIIPNKLRLVVYKKCLRSKPTSSLHA